MLPIGRQYLESFAKEYFLAAVRNRFTSLLSMFDDTELEEGIEEIRREHPEDVLEFEDHYAFVIGRRL